jgi:hypothetical protein
MHSIEMLLLIDVCTLCLLAAPSILNELKQSVAAELFSDSRG